MNKELSANLTLSHYRIVSKIGAGGMGEVYLAEDMRLHRKVALKILPAEPAENQDRMRRFTQEATAAAALNHPNIATIHEIGEYDGTHYIVMELVDGLTLREEIHQNRTELRKLLKYLQQVAEGLAKAHAAGIVHRDLKPDNIMVTRDGHAKILDFGLAKLIEQQPVPAGNSDEVATAVMPRPSSPGAIMGTVGYMSPEQAKAKTVDQRSDIFSFGCVLYETVTGRKPFEGDSVVDTLHKIIHDSPPLITDSNPNTSPELQRVIRRCLAKDPDERFQSIKDVAIELKELRRELEGVAVTASAAVKGEKVSVKEATGTQSGADKTGNPAFSLSTRASGPQSVVAGFRHREMITAVVAGLVLITAIAALAFYLRGRSTSGAIQSIAVLPFQNRSADQDTDYLSDGLAESLIFRLSQLPGLKVSPTSSVMQYKGKEADLGKIASELGVDSILTGRFNKRGDNLEITVELVDTRNNKSLWGEQYERKMADLLATQREIANVITQKLQLQLAGNEVGLTKKYTSSNTAYQLYLKGRFHWAKRTRDDLQKAIEFYKQAIELDPNFALAYVGIAYSYNSMGKDPDVAPKDAIPFAKTAASRALEIDPSLAEAHSAMADSLAIGDWNWAESGREFKRAIELDPNISYIHIAYAGSYLTAAGRPDEVVSESERGLELEPLSLINNTVTASSLLYGRKFDQAQTQARKAFDLDQNFPLSRLWLGFAYIANGKYDDAIALGNDGSPQSPAKWTFLCFTALAHAKAGHRDEAEKIIGKLREIANTQYVRSYYVAMIYAALGDKDNAFAELEKSFRDKDCYLPRARIDPFMDPLREDARFKDLMKRMGLPE